LNGSDNFQATIPALPYSPLCDGVNVGNNWNNVNPTPPSSGLNPGHCVGRIQDVLPLTAVEYDHYQPAVKNLINYPIAYSLQAIVKINPPVPVPMPANIQPTQANVNILTQILNLLLNFFKG